MGTVGEVSIDLNNIGGAINNTNQLVERVLEGVADQGALIGLAIGIMIAIIALMAIVLYMLNKVTQTLGKVRGLGGSMR